MRKGQTFGLALLSCSAIALAAPAAARFDYIAGIQTVPVAAGAPAATEARGVVFHDLSRDGIRQADEPGIAGVLVTNGREVVRTGADGSYALPVRDDMTLMVVKPAGYVTPTDADGVPQFFYTHKPAGTPGQLRYGGIAPTGPLPAEVNFPLLLVAEPTRFSCIITTDTQPYSGDELGMMRDGLIKTLMTRDLSDARCLVVLGDVMGDDLGLLARLKDQLSVAGLPLYLVHGNHDFDFDATSDADSADSWRTLYGPNYYAFEIGKVMFVVLDNVVYPCTAGEARADDRQRCGADPARPIYNGRVEETQMTFLRNLVAELPADRMVVLMHHIPMVSFIDQETGRHQTDNASEIHALLAGRPALSFSGHTHTLEYLAAGEWFGGWAEKVGVTRLPFDHVIAGAASGNWYWGDLGFDGTPLAFTRTGEPPGFLEVVFDGTEYTLTFHAVNQPADRQLGLAFNTPQFRRWFDALRPWIEARQGVSEAPPPVSVNDLDDLKLFTPAELAEGVFLTANFWMGDRNARVVAQINDGPALAMERTQPGEGEGMRRGAEWADPFALPRQATLGRFAWASTEGDPRAQGFEVWTGVRKGPAVPQPVDGWMLTEQTLHLWRLRLPEDLPEGTHVATVTATDRHGRRWTDRIVFEVRAERPARYWRSELWTQN